MEEKFNFLDKPWPWIAAAAIICIVVPSPAIGLLAGAAIGLTRRETSPKLVHTVSKKALQWAVILLGFGLHLKTIIEVGTSSVGVTVLSVGGTVVLGLILGKLFRIDRDLSVLLSSGTAICGGSAIAAMAPAIGASQSNTAVALAVIFLLNGIGLVLFPPLGHMLGLTEPQFGFWAALAVHDTSSVVGSCAAYGAVALAVGTTVKLTRALWIIPMALLGARFAKSDSDKKPPFPWFLIGFIAAATVRTALPQFETLWDMGAQSGKLLMSGILFLIGGTLRLGELKRIGGKSLAMAVLLWIVVASLSLIAALNFEMY